MQTILQTLPFLRLIMVSPPSSEILARPWHERDLGGLRLPESYNDRRFLDAPLFHPELLRKVWPAQRAFLSKRRFSIS
jgi:hypothetical protein